MIIVDLRTAAEANADPIPGATRMSTNKPPVGPHDVGMLAQQLATIPPGLDVGFVCAKGIRSALAASMLSAVQPTRTGQILNIGGMQDPAVRAWFRARGFSV